MLNRWAILRGAALLCCLALLRCRTLLRRLALLCPLPNGTAIGDIPPSLLTAAQALAKRGARRTGRTGAGEASKRLATAPLLEPLARFW